jgi:hypothetical protein
MLVLLSYLLVVALGIWLLRTAYRVHVHHDYRYIKYSRNQPAENAHRVARPFAVTAACLGVGVLLLAVAIPILHIPFKAWASLLGLFTWPAMLMRAWIIRQLQKPA